MRKGELRQVVFKLWEDNPGNSPKEILEAVFNELGEKKSNNRTYPTLRRVQQLISDFEENSGQLVDEDKPWSVAASVKYGLPSEATKELFDIWRFSLAKGSPISIRQAKWIVNIRGLYSDPKTPFQLDEYQRKVIRTLWLIRQSWLYSILERASRVMGEKYFDTTNLDADSFMHNRREYITALELGKLSQVDYSQEALAKIEKHGTRLTSPSYSIVSVEDAVWHEVRTIPDIRDERGKKIIPPYVMDGRGGNPPLSEEDDLVCAYWLNYLSKGSLWCNLPHEKPKSLSRGGMHIDSGEWMGQDQYLAQNKIRRRLINWVIRHPGIANINPKLLKIVGYPVSDDDLKNYEQKENERNKQIHLGWDALLPDVKIRIIYDEETSEDLRLLEITDKAVIEKEKSLEQELISLVDSKGDQLHTPAFWERIRDEWVEKHPEFQTNLNGYLQPYQIELEYKTIKREKTGG